MTRVWCQAWASKGDSLKQGHNNKCDIKKWRFTWERNHWLKGTNHHSSRKVYSQPSPTYLKDYIIQHNNSEKIVYETIGRNYFQND